jgi:hypothetical protein
MIIVLTALVSIGHGAEFVRLPKTEYINKCKGAWAGQMIGVVYGEPYEFKSNGRIIEGDLQPWAPDRVNCALAQDDCYVEMSFLAAIEKYGPDITHEQAGKAFAAGSYGPMAHAIRSGWANCRNGIMPPLSGHPLFNRHADDIDFQIHADVLGIICPGLPRESNRLSEVFGSLMNYGDGVYGGLFVAGMYTAAYFESTNVRTIIQAGLDCIPPQSGYHQCISDVLRWHQEDPADWRSTWQKIETKWNDDDDCIPGDPMNVGAKLNGAYVVVGLLYGKGDLLKTVEIATRCGQDADCNPSNAAGILGCMKGYAALGERFTSGIPVIENRTFSYAPYSLKTLIPACLRVAEQVIVQAGGQVNDEALLIAVQKPKPPETLEQWTDRTEAQGAAVSRNEMRLWDPAWRLVACSEGGNAGYYDEVLGHQRVLRVHPFKDRPAVIAADLRVPDSGSPKLNVEAASQGNTGFLLRLRVNDKLVKESRIRTHGKWATESTDVSTYAGKTVNVRIEAHFIDGRSEKIYLGRAGID